MGLIHRKFTFPAGYSCHQVVMRETDGFDEKDASKMSDVRDTSITAELIRCSVVQVRWDEDGEFEKVEQPFTALDGWTTKTRELLMEAYASLNECPPDEKAVFHAAGEDVAELVKRAMPRERGSIPTIDE